MTRPTAMRGLLCAEFVQWAETALPDAVLHRLPLAAAGRATGPDDFLVLVEHLAVQIGEPAAVLRTFGIHLFARLAARYPVFFVDAAGAVPFLARLETHVLGEVRKLDPVVSVPRFDVRTPEAGRVELHYDGPAPFAELTDGLLRGCVLHFDDDAAVVERLPVDPAAALEVRFTITRRGRTESQPAACDWGVRPV